MLPVGCELLGGGGCCPTVWFCFRHPPSLLLLLLLLLLLCSCSSWHSWHSWHSWRSCCLCGCAVVRNIWDAEVIRFPRFLMGRSRGFRPLGGAESLSLCLSKEKVTREKGHPGTAPSARKGPSGARGDCGGFRRHVHVPAKTSRASMRATLRADPPSPRRGTGAPL